MVDSSQFDGFDRRAMLATTAGVAAAALAGCAASGSTTDRASVEFDGWFDDTANYDGVADKTGTDEVEVTVGAKGNGGHFAFAPAAIKVTAGTTVVWKWSGAGSMHNVVADDGSFESKMRSTAGATFEHAFERAGTYKYYCSPHKSAGMKGVVVVE